MCQIFAGPSNQIRTALLTKPGLLENLLKRNKDGLGAMYATKKNLLRTPKIVPQDLAAATAFIRQLPDDDRNLVIHFRMKTSGKIDHDNAHPFIVIEDEVAMTHNGILSYPTRSDETMCDTRHYIRDVIRPQLMLCPALMFSESWQWLVGEEIRSNRFVMMNRYGQMAFVNKSTGYDFGDIWFANKYSFDAALLDETLAPPPKTQPHWSHQGYGGTSMQNGVSGYWSKGKFVPFHSQGTSMMDDGWDDESLLTGCYGKAQRGNVPALPNGAKPDAGSGKPSSAEESAQVLLGVDPETGLDEVEMEQLAENVREAVAVADAGIIRQALLLAPKAVLDILFDGAQYMPGVPTDDDKYSKLDEQITNYLVDQDVDALVALVGVSTARAQNVAEVICWFGEWVDRIVMSDQGIVDRASAEVIQAVTEAKGEIVGPSAADLSEAEGNVKAIEMDLANLDAEQADLAKQRQFLKDELELARSEAAMLAGPTVTQAMQDAMVKLDMVSAITREVATVH